MNPFSTPVIAAAVLVSSPALWSSLMGRMRLEVGLTRFLVAVVLCWLALSFVAMLVGPPPARVRPAEDEAEPGQDKQHGRGQQAGQAQPAGQSEQDAAAGNHTPDRESAGRVR